MEPHEYSRRILVSVAGLTPQVITETLFALIKEREPGFTPTEVHVLTTSEGAKSCRLTLLDPDKGQFHQFCRDFNLDDTIEFNKNNIHVIPSVAGTPLPDIRTREENTAGADFITDFIRKITGDPDSALHLSLAGGRKTMGFYLGYAMSLFGREQDRLSHVLVTPEFESNREFFYPPPRPKVLHTRDERPIHTSDAEVTLAEIPFVRLRAGLEEPFLSDTWSYRDTVAAAQRSAAPPEIAIDLQAHRLVCNGTDVPLPDLLLAWYAWMAQRRLTPGLDHGGWVHWSEADANEFLALYARLVGKNSGQYEKTESALADGFNKDYFLEKNSRINKQLKKTLGSIAARAYRIDSDGRRPLSRNGLTLAANAIRLKR